MKPGAAEPQPPFPFPFLRTLQGAVRRRQSLKYNWLSSTLLNVPGRDLRNPPVWLSTPELRLPTIPGGQRVFPVNATMRRVVQEERNSVQLMINDANNSLYGVSQKALHTDIVYGQAGSFMAVND